MIEDRIREIQDRLQATTPGEWIVHFAKNEKFDPNCPKEDPSIESESGQFVAITTYDTISTTCRPTMYADAEFIAHAKADMLFLLELLKVSFEK